MNSDEIDTDSLWRLQAMWLDALERRRRLAPELSPYTGNDASWQARLEQYRRAHDKEDGATRIAISGDGRKGYLVSARRAMPWDATFALPPDQLEILSLHGPSGSEDIRDRLHEDAERRAAALGLSTICIGALPADIAAIEDLTSRGFVAAWLELTRPAGPAALARQHESPPRLVIETCAPDEVEMLKPLWLALHRHHQDASPHLAPFVDDESSWSIIRASWQKHARAGLLFISRQRGGSVISGMASAALYKREEMGWLSDSWSTGPLVGELKYLSVAKEMRGQGIGSALSDAIDRRLAQLGATYHLVGAIAPNAEAISFYERRGFRPAFLQMLKADRLAEPS